jgi:hypothetical protein
MLHSVARRGMTRPRAGCDHDHLHTKGNGWHRFARFDGRKTNGNESAMFCVIPAFGSFRRTVSCVYAAFAAHLFRPFRATDVGGGPFTQGGARRLRRLALPWANMFCPFGAWVVHDARRSLRGWSAPLAPSQRDTFVITPRRGNDKIAQGRASRRKRDAPPWVAPPRRAALGRNPPQDPSPRRGMTRPRTGRAHDICELDENGLPRFAGHDGRNEWQRIGHHPCDSGIRIISTHGFARMWRVCRAFVSPLQATL